MGQNTSLHKAWVITRERQQTPFSIVVGILSSRKTGNIVKEYVEWLYMLLYCLPETHLEFARYTKPLVPCKAEFYRTNTNTPVDTGMRCGHTPWLEARRASKISLIDVDDGPPVLKWTNPARIECDPMRPHHIVNKIPGATCQAPVYLPLLTMPLNLLAR
jgi:hypothetical protein